MKKEGLKEVRAAHSCYLVFFPVRRDKDFGFSDETLTVLTFYSFSTPKGKCSLTAL
jgi:hypothetical protein